LTYNGETPTTDGLYTVVKFLTSGEFVAPDGVTEADVLIVGGGGAGGIYASGGGGAGGVLQLTDVALSGTMAVVIGAGGPVNPAESNNRGQNGEDSTFAFASLIPAMTGATTPSGAASSSGEYEGNEAWRAFDHSNAYSNGWACTSTNGWLKYQFPEAQTVTKYAITGIDHAAVRGPRAWVFEGSTDGSSWTTLDTQTHGAWGNKERVEYPVDNTTAYLYYRLNGNNDGVSEDALIIGELEMFSGYKAIGGGGGGCGTVPNGKDGGSGGGAGGGGTGGVGTAGQGHDGGGFGWYGSTHGGGGGAGAVGGEGQQDGYMNGGVGGAGITWHGYEVGGGGGGEAGGGDAPGGLGGGGAASANNMGGSNPTGVAGTPNTGGGGGAGWYQPIGYIAGAGGSGILVIRWLTAIEDPYTTVTFTESGDWEVPAGVTEADVLIVAGGGAGGTYCGAGGGAGGVITATGVALSGSMAVVVGDGAPVPVNNGHGADGNDSTFAGMTAVAGGGGGAYGFGLAGNVGGSGGGSCYFDTTHASGTTDQGHAGGCADGYSAGGGGGAGAVGQDGTFSTAGDGGAGITWHGLSVGGGGGSYMNGSDYGSGGAGGGGRGSDGVTHAQQAESGAPNTGGGGGAGWYEPYGSLGGGGGSGVVIIRYLTPGGGGATMVDIGGTIYAVSDLSADLTAVYMLNMEGTINASSDLHGELSRIAFLNIQGTISALSSLYGDLAILEYLRLKGVVHAYAHLYGELSGGFSGDKFKRFKNVISNAHKADRSRRRVMTITPGYWDEHVYLHCDATGGTIYDVGDERIHVFKGDGVFAITPGFTLDCKVLVVGGGGAGGGGSSAFAGGGGGGQVIYEASVPLSGILSVVIGAGGVGVQGVEQNSGESTFFAGLEAIGGGAGGSAGHFEGLEGASGGGHAGISYLEVALGHIPDESVPGAHGLAGNDGGAGYWGTESYGFPQPGGGGGGGAAGPGLDCTQFGDYRKVVPGDGGPGYECDIIPENIRPCQFYGAGGGGCWGITSYPGGGGGLGGSPWGSIHRTGGNMRPETGGGWENPSAADWPHGGYQNSGSGGGGGTQAAWGGPNVGYGGNGAEGIVVVRYTQPPDLQARVWVPPVQRLARFSDVTSRRISGDRVK